MKLGRMTALVVVLLVNLFITVPRASAVPIVNDSFENTWARTDKPVADLVVSRTWMWGNEPFTAAGPEKYVEGPGGYREVQYFDKSRMEINHDPKVPVDSPWHVTNGLLVRELMTGQVQVGDNAFETREPARVNVAGDPDDDSGVTYWFVGLLQTQPALPEGTVLNRILTPGAAGNLFLFSDQLAAHGITAARYVPETQHTVAGPFWDFMNAQGTVFEFGSYHDAQLFENPFYATGLPLTEAYWAQVKLAGKYQHVLIQCFERRCLTYTPSNDPAWRVEAGNVGQHYFRWRYGGVPTGPDPQPEPVESYEWSATWSGIPKPMGMDTDSQGNVYVTAFDESTRVHALGKFAPDGSLLWSRQYSYSDNYYDDVAVVDSEGEGFVFVSDASNQRVQVFSTAGATLWDWQWKDCRFNDPPPCNEFWTFFGSGIEADDNFNVYVISGNKVAQFTYTGELRALVNLGGAGGWDIELDRVNGGFYVADPEKNAIHKLDSSGRFVETWSGFNRPFRVAIDQGGLVYVADSSNSVIKLSASGERLTSWGSAGTGNGQLDRPRGIAVDHGGNVYVADYGNNRVQRFSASN